MPWIADHGNYNGNQQADKAPKEASPTEASGLTVSPAKSYSYELKCQRDTHFKPLIHSKSCLLGDIVQLPFLHHHINCMQLFNDLSCFHGN